MAYNNSYFNPYQRQMPEPYPNTQSILWVQGEAGAKSYLVTPGTSVLLMDSEAERFYIKSADASGMPQPLRVYEYKEIGAEAAETEKVSLDDKYVARQEYDDLRADYEDILDRLKLLEKKVSRKGASDGKSSV